MANYQTVTNVSSLTTAVNTFFDELNDAADGPGKTPYLDGRELAGLFTDVAASFNHCVQGTFTILDENSDAEVILGFVPKLVIIHISEPLLENLYIKIDAMATGFALKLLVIGQVLSLADNRMWFRNSASSRLDAFTMDTTELQAESFTDGVAHYIAMG